MTNVKKISAFALIIIVSTAIMAQQPAAGNAQTRPAAGASAASQTGQPPAAGSGSVGEGFGSVTWGSAYQTVRENISGALKYTDENKLIISQDGELTYSYGFFYKDPEVTGNPEPAPSVQPGAGDNAQPSEAAEGKLFFVKVEFPYLAYEDVRAKYIERFGDPQGSTVEKNRGVLLWENEKTMVVVWVDEYEKKPYCRKITYMSKEIVKELADYKKLIFTKREIDALSQLPAPTRNE